MSDKPKETKFHFIRVRANNEPSFYDQQADIRCILPVLGKLVCDDLEAVHKGDSQWHNDISYLRNCLDVFAIRIDEDNTPLVEQMQEFIQAISKVNPQVFAQFSSGVFIMMSVVYGAMQRRDVKIDGKDQRKMLSVATLLDVMRFLPKNLVGQIFDTLEETGDLLHEAVVSVTNASVVDMVRDGDVVGTFDRLKEHAAMFINAEGDTSWNGLANACEEMFNAIPPDANLHDKVALALAYPTYKLPTQCEMPADDAERQD